MMQDVCTKMNTPTRTHDVFTHNIITTKMAHFPARRNRMYNKYYQWNVHNKNIITPSSNARKKKKWIAPIPSPRKTNQKATPGWCWEHKADRLLHNKKPTKYVVLLFMLINTLVFAQTAQRRTKMIAVSRCKTNKKTTYWYISWDAHRMCIELVQQRWRKCHIYTR